MRKEALETLFSNYFWSYILGHIDVNTAAEDSTHKLPHLMFSGVK